ncbi:MAG TPA: methylated-DNA--[protein]-cysteine S-methyltransferase, partial [Reyranella sp.]
KNVDFHPSPEAAEAAGFRPCKRCRPREWQAELGLSRSVAQACALFDAADADQPPSLAAVARTVGVNANTLSKRFVAELGLTPRDWLIARKRERFRKALRNGEKVTEALYGAGYGSPSRVYESSDKALGMTPATYAKGGAGAHIDYTTVESDYGRVLVAATQKGIAAVFLGDSDRTLERDLKQDFPAAEIERNDGALAPRVKGVLARLYGRKPTALDAPDVPLDIVGTAFQWKVWKALTEIPSGETRTYGEIAQRIGAPGSARAVGRACATNQAAGVIPCHRAVGSNGSLTGYRWGVARKERLLAGERRRSST